MNVIRIPKCVHFTVSAEKKIKDAAAFLHKCSPDRQVLTPMKAKRTCLSVAAETHRAAGSMNGGNDNNSILAHSIIHSKRHLH